MTAVITPEQLRAALDRGEAFDLVDVRTPAEFREAHLAVARNVPLDRLDPAAWRADSHADRAKPLYVVCRSGSPAAKPARNFPPPASPAWRTSKEEPSPARRPGCR